jgi:hypothetical protein
MMSAVVSLARDQQHLIDIRLDSLDRILMDSGVDRSERSEIVQAVEDQRFEMLDQKGENVTRESVLQLLRSLDPPEAYWAAADITERTTRGSRREAFSDRQQRSVQQFPYGAVSSKTSGLAIASFVLAMISIPTIIIVPVGSLLSIAGLICGIIALPSIAASSGRLHGRWMAIIGCAVFALHVSAGLLLVMSNM